MCGREIGGIWVRDIEEEDDDDDDDDERDMDKVRGV